MTKTIIAKQLILLAKNLLAEEFPAIFDVGNAQEAINKLKSHIKAPFVNGYMSDLGGAEHASLMMTVSLDKKEDWSNGIMQNSRYFNFSLERNGVLEVISGGTRKLKFRKTKVKSIDDSISKLNKYISELEKIGAFY